MCRWLYLCAGKGFEQSKGVAFIDATALVVCANTRIHQHQVFAGGAQRGRTSMGWFFGFKLHLVINHQGEIISFCLTTGNTNDRKPVELLTRNLWGRPFADKGYISQSLKECLKAKGVDLITKLRKNMKQQFLPLFDQLQFLKVPFKNLDATYTKEKKREKYISTAREGFGFPTLVLKLMADPKR